MKVMEIKKIHKSYKDTSVLKGIDFSMEKGKIYIIKGRSGSGKSTFLNICSFLEKADSGEILFCGQSTEGLSEKLKKQILREKIGYVFQEYNLFENLSVFENLRLYLLAISDKNENEIQELIEEKLRIVGLLEKKDEKVKLLSGGERQRVTVARVLLIHKEVIFADEPSANIDDENAKVIVKIFEDMKSKGTTLLIVTHDDIFDSIGDEIYTLEKGVLV